MNVRHWGRTARPDEDRILLQTDGRILDAIVIHLPGDQTLIVFMQVNQYEVRLPLRKQTSLHGAFVPIMSNLQGITEMLCLVHPLDIYNTHLPWNLLLHLESLCESNDRPLNAALMSVIGTFVTGSES